MAFYNQRNSNKEKRGVFKFFELFCNKFSKLILLNLAYFACIFPLFCAALSFVCVLFSISAHFVESFFFANVIMRIVLWTIEHIPAPIYIAVIIASAAAYGPLTAGLTYCTKKIVVEEHFWISELFSRAKSNLKQAFAFGIVDIVVISSLLLYLAADFSALIGGTYIFYSVIRILAVIIAVIYFWIRFYSYTILTTFELQIKDIFKNSWIFCVLGFFKNILASVICILAMLSFISTPKIDIVLIACLLFSFCRFSVLFCTYPVIKEYMLNPKTKASQALEAEENEPEDND